jgi:hypothetical protein
MNIFCIIDKYILKEKRSERDMGLNRICGGYVLEELVLLSFAESGFSI